MSRITKSAALASVCILGIGALVSPAKASYLNFEDKAALKGLVLNFGTVTLRVEDKPLTQEEFASKAIDCNKCEMDLAKQATKKATSADVREYAQKLVDDHEKMGKDLKAFAADKKIGIVTGVSKEHKEHLAELTKATGKDYDQKFIQMMIDSHEKALKMLNSCSKDSKDASIRDICDKSIPTIQKHLDDAKAVQKKL